MMMMRTSTNSLTRITINDAAATTNTKNDFTKVNFTTHWRHIREFFSLNDHELLAKHSSILQKDLGKAGKLPLPF